MRPGEAPPRSGYQPGEKSDEHRRLIQQTSEAAKKYHVESTDPIHQLKSALDRAKTSVRNWIADRTKEIESGEKIVQERTELKSDAELDALRAERDVVRKLYEAAFPKAEKTAEQNIEAAEKALDRVIENVEKDIAGTSEKPTPKPSAWSPKIAGQHAKLKALKDVREFVQLTRRLAEYKAGNVPAYKPLKPKERTAALLDLRKQVRDTLRHAWKTDIDKAKMDRALVKLAKVEKMLKNELRKPKNTKEEIPEDLADINAAVRNFIKEMNVEDRITSLEKQMATGVPEIKPEKRVYDEPVSLLQKRVNLHHIEKRYDEWLERLRPKTWGNTTLIYALEVGGLPRAMMTTLDRSMMGRQGALISARRPTAAMRAAWQAEKAFWSKNSAELIDAKMRADPEFYLMDKVFFSKIDGRLEAGEEAYFSQVAHWFPGIKQSNRQAVTYLNQLRFTRMKEFLAAHPNAARVELDAMSDYVNNATGRGSLDDFESASVKLSQAFFSIRNVVSKFTTPTMMFKYWKLPRVRNEIAKDTAAYLTWLGGIATLAVGAGATISFDHRDPDFLKLKFGNTRIDPYAGYQQAARLALSLGTWITDMSGWTGKDLLRSEVNDNILNTVGRFIASKLSPSITVPIELGRGKDYNDQPVTLLDTAYRSLLPMYVNAISDAYTKNEGSVGHGVLAGTSEFIGFGGNTYEDSESKTRRDAVKLYNDGKYQAAQDKIRAWNYSAPKSKRISSDWLKTRQKQLDAEQAK